eukprot:gene28757-35672_t
MSISREELETLMLEVEQEDPIDFADLPFAEQELRGLVASHLVEMADAMESFSEEDRRLTLMAVAAKLVLENLVLHIQMLRQHGLPLSGSADALLSRLRRGETGLRRFLRNAARGRHRQFHVGLGHRHAGQNVAFALFVRAQAGPLDQVTHAAAAHAADTGAAGAVAARAGQADTGLLRRHQQRAAVAGVELPALDGQADLHFAWQAAPVIAQVREAKLQKLVFGVGVSTDSGPRLSIDHTHNQWPTQGWRAINKLSLDKKAQQIGTGWTALPGENGWRWFTSGLAQRQQTGDYDVNSVEVLGGRSQSTKNIDRTYYLRYDTSRAQGLNAPADSAALSVNYGWTGRYFNSNTAPTRGYGIAVELGAGVTLRPERHPFTRTLVRWQSFFPAGRVEAGDGAARSARIAVRTEVGAVLARESAEIPVAQLFLTGGDTTVRGYGYRAIGARTDNNQLYGGRYMGVASVEWQRPIVYGGNMTDWESTLFVDAGAVADRVGDLDPRVGVGTGVRWRRPGGRLACLRWRCGRWGLKLATGARQSARSGIRRRKPMKIEVIVGHILKHSDMKAVVNSANANLRFDSGLAPLLAAQITAKVLARAAVVAPQLQRLRLCVVSEFLRDQYAWGFGSSG